MGSEAGPTFRNLILDAGATGVELVAAANPSAARFVLSTLSATEISDLIASAVASLVDSSPGTLDTLNELAAALGDDANFSTTITAAIGAKYTLPGTGIPATDLAEGVNSSLELADSAVQPGDLATVATSGSYNDLTDTPSGGGIDTLGTSGTDLNISGSTLNVPNASATARGVVTTGAQTIAGAKTFAAGISVTGNVVASGSLLGVSGTMGISGNGVYTTMIAYGQNVCAFSHYGYVVAPQQFLYSWNNSNSWAFSASHPDTSIGRLSAGTVRIIAGLSGAADGHLVVGNVIASGTTCSGVYTVGTLPSAAANAGKEAQVTDAADALSSATVGTTVSGGGANRVKVFSNGSNWVYA